MSYPIVEKRTYVHAKHCSYRLRPNPDCGVGYEAGAVLEINDDKEWGNYFHVEPSAMESLGHALIQTAQELKGSNDE